MISRRDLLRMGALSAGSMGLRQLGLRSARAQAVNDYRALVCVFLTGGNDSNNLLVPQDEARYRAYAVAAWRLGLKRQTTDTSRVHQEWECALRLPRRSPGTRSNVLEWSTGGGRECGDASPTLNRCNVSGALRRYSP